MELKMLNVRGFLLFFVLTVILVAISPWASQEPDGLERVAEDLRIDHLAESNGGVEVESLLAELVGENTTVTLVSGLIGVGGAFVMICLILRFLLGSRPDCESNGENDCCA